MPNVLLNQQPTTLSKDGKSLDESLEADTDVDLLLVVGTSLETQGIYKIVKTMAQRVHRRGGAAIYVDRRKAGKKLAALFDMQLQVDIEEWSRCTTIAVKEACAVSLIVRWGSPTSDTSC